MLKLRKSVFVIIISLCIITGCSKNEIKLICTLKSNDINEEIILEYVFIFDKQKEELKSYREKSTMIYSNSLTDEIFKEIFGQTKDSCNKLNKEKGKKCSFKKINDKKVVAEIIIDVSKLSQSERLSQQPLNFSYNEAIEYMENNGITCEEK